MYFFVCYKPSWKLGSEIIRSAKQTPHLKMSNPVGKEEDYRHVTTHQSHTKPFVEIQVEASS